MPRSAYNGAVVATRGCAASGTRLRCLGRTKDGSPRHPLYVRAAGAVRGDGMSGGFRALAGCGEPVTGPARRLTIGYWAGDNAVLTGPSTLISGAAPSPRDADGPR